MINPFGLDDDDFEIDLIIERNLAASVAYSYVDDMYEKLPPLVAINLEALPHTKASAALITKMNPMVGSAAGVQVPYAQQRVLSKEDTEAIKALVVCAFWYHQQPMNLVHRLSKSPSHVEYTAPAPSVEDLSPKQEQSIYHQVRNLTPASSLNVSRQSETLDIKKEVASGLINRAVEDFQLKKAVEQKRDRLKYIIDPVNDDSLDLTQENSNEPTCRPPQSSPYDSMVLNK
uniref:Bestrophin homolog n=1 Tax=Heterorhabditis bacteriophora TaxID=37862 RepID=A0A1I7WTR2_HETBA